MPEPHTACPGCGLSLLGQWDRHQWRGHIICTDCEETVSKTHLRITNIHDLNSHRKGCRRLGRRRHQ